MNHPTRAEGGAEPKRLEVWAEEGGIMLVLEQDQPHRVRFKVITPRVQFDDTTPTGTRPSEDVHAEATIASFRWERIADFLTTAKAEHEASLPHRVLQEEAP